MLHELKRVSAAKWEESVRAIRQELIEMEADGPDGCCTAWDCLKYTVQFGPTTWDGAVMWTLDGVVDGTYDRLPAKDRRLLLFAVPWLIPDEDDDGQAPDADDDLRWELRSEVLRLAADEAPSEETQAHVDAEILDRAERDIEPYRP